MSGDQINVVLGLAQPKQTWQEQHGQNLVSVTQKEWDL
jgi:hypothetical protein